MNNLALMARFDQWVNGHIYDSVAELSDEDYRRDCKAFFGSIHNTLNHLLVVDRLWTSRIRRIGHGIKSLTDVLFDDFEPLRAARVREDESLIDLVDSFDDDRIASPVVYTRMLGDGEQQTRLDHILITLYNHQTHHRGQVHAMLTQAGVTPTDIDVIYFLESIDLS
jgi:uncharacterized damage-inducible protein DinB